MKFRGKVWKFGDHVDTDLIIPARYLNVSDKDELAKNCFADLRPEFTESVQEGDIILAGSNFGCGSSREHAPLAIKAAGIGVVIAKSFARIFYRNAFNIGLPLLVCKDAVNVLSDGEEAVVDLQSGEIVSLVGNGQALAEPIPDFMQNIVRSGGLVSYVKQHDFRARNEDP